MKSRTFTEEERMTLLQHKHIAKVTAHSVSFTPEFKKFALAEHAKGRRPQDVFITEGIPVTIIGRRIPERATGLWRRMVTERGIEALDHDGRGQNKTSHIKRKKKSSIDESTMNDKELIEYYKTKIAYTESENDFLARTRGIPRWAPFEYRPGSNTKS
jgi:hypothetical protein